MRKELVNIELNTNGKMKIKQNYKGKWYPHISFKYGRYYAILLTYVSTHGQYIDWIMAQDWCIERNRAIVNEERKKMIR
jgi:hypothetical protein